MRSLWAGGLSCLLAWQTSGPVAADDGRVPVSIAPAASAQPAGVALGRPQPLATAGGQRTRAPSGIALTAFAAPVTALKPVANDSAATPSTFATMADVWSVPPARATGLGLGGGSAVDPTPPRSTGRSMTTVQAESLPMPAEPGLDLGSPALNYGDDFDGDYDEDSGWSGWLNGLGGGMGGTGSNRFYASADYLLWWIKGSSTPPLVSTGPIAGGGVLGTFGTASIFGGPGALEQPVFSGGRLNLGYWLDPAQLFAADFNIFFLAERSIRFASASTGFPLLGRPFFSANTQSEFAKVTATPGQAGAITVDAPSHLWGMDVNVRTNLWRGDNGRIDLLAGLRYLELQEGLHITEASQLLAGGMPQSLTLDRFDTLNQFYGVQVGMLGEMRRGPWSLDLRAKVALGDSYRSVTIRGGQGTNGPGGQNVFVGGLLALPSNSGRFRQDRFAVVPEANLTIGYQVTDNLRATVGYTLIYWSNVLRPGDQVDRALDATLIPNTPQPGVPSAGRLRPSVPFKGRDFWAQGVNLGLEYRY